MDYQARIHLPSPNKPSLRFVHRQCSISLWHTSNRVHNTSPRFCHTGSAHRYYSSTLCCNSRASHSRDFRNMLSQRGCVWGDCFFRTLHSNPKLNPYDTNGKPDQRNHICLRSSIPSFCSPLRGSTTCMYIHSNHMDDQPCNGSFQHHREIWMSCARKNGFE